VNYAVGRGRKNHRGVVMLKYLISFVSLGAMLVLATNVQAVGTATGKHLSPMRFVLTRQGDVANLSSMAKLALSSKNEKIDTAASTQSAVPSYNTSTGVLSGGQLIYATGSSGSNVCYDTTFATTATSPNIKLTLTAATQVTCPATSNSFFDGTTLTLSEMNYVENGNVTKCYSVAMKWLSTSPGYVFQVTSATADTCETAHTLDTTKLPVGDTKVTLTTPAVGYLYACSAGSSSAGGASSKGPWFNSDGVTWDLSKKESVSGTVSWTSSFNASFGSSLGISGDGLPSHTTGTYPIPTSDAVHQYDGNPNTIKQNNISWSLPSNPVYSSTPYCAGGEVGVLLTGARMYSAVDGEDRDAKAWEGQDSCQGHPDSGGYYHYHAVSTCAVKSDVQGQHSNLVGYALDGFAIYGYEGEDGVALTNDNLDVCHGHTHAITVNGKTVVQYHYHATQEFPYSVGCFRSKAVNVH
jgi:hypothetical protein